MTYKDDDASLLKNRLVDIINHTSDFIRTLDRDGKVLFINPAMCEVVGESERDALSKTNLDQYHSHEEVSRMKHELFPKAKKEGIVHTHLTFLSKDGSEIPTSIVMIAHKDDDGDLEGFSVIARDVRKEMAAIDALRESQHSYESLASAAPVAIFRIDIIGKLLYANQLLSEISGLSNRQMLSSGWRQAIHEDDRERIESEIKGVLENRCQCRIEFRLIHQTNGKAAWVDLSLIPELDRLGKIIGYIGTLSDITMRKEAEESARQRQAELAHISRLNLAGEMVSGIAHQLNQPLAVIVNYIGGCKARLANNGDVNDILPVMDRIAQQAEHAGEIIHHLKNFLRKDSFVTTLVSLNQIISESVNLLESELKKNDVKIILSLSEALPKISLEKIQIEQVFVNIIQNAIEALRDVSGRERSIHISTRLKGNSMIEVIISDNGCGIKKETLPMLFDSFVTTKKKGMGIGLSISRSIIESHRGDIRAENNQKKGSRFIVLLPATKIIL